MHDERSQQRADRQQGYIVLARRVDQAIIIDHEIEVKVIEIRDGKVRLAIHAPGKVVHRQEVELAIAREELER